MSITVIVADDHPSVRVELAHMLEWSHPEIRVIASVANGVELLNAAALTPADIYLVDVSMPVMNGVEATEKLLLHQPDAKVIMISMYESDAYVRRTLRAGARGYVLKDCACEELAPAIREVMAGGSYLSTSLPTAVPIPA